MKQFSISILLVFVLGPAVAGLDLYEAELKNPSSGKLEARVVGILDSSKGIIQIETYQFLKQPGSLMVGRSDQPNVALLNFKGQSRDRRNWAMSPMDSQALVREQLTVELRNSKGQTIQAALTKSSGSLYQIEITNITKGQILSPPVAFSHVFGHKAFQLGQPASDGLLSLAEEGNGSVILAETLNTENGYHGTVGHAPIAPGETATLTVAAGGRYGNISVLGMLVQTNDGFFAVDGLRTLSFPPKTATVTTVASELALAYDAGTEANNEVCAYVPGCGGMERDSENSEGYVYSHPGIHGIGDLATSDYDWRGPVALVKMSRISGQKSTVIQNVTVVDGTGSAPLEGATVVITGNRISKITTEVYTPDAFAEVVDGTGKFVVPGFIDMHTHYWETGAPDTAPTTADFRHVLPWEEHRAWINERAPYTFSRFLCGGVTTMVEMSSPYYGFTLQRETADLPYTSRLRICGRFLGNTDFGFDFWTPEDPAVVGTYDANQAHGWVSEALDMGAQHTKLGYVSIGRPLEEWLPVFDAVVNETHSRGLRVAIHVTEREPAKEFIRRGADILAHPLWEDAPDDEYIQLMKENGTFLTTTLAILPAFANVWNGNPDLIPIEETCGDQQIIDSWNWLHEIPEDLQPPDPDLLELVPAYTQNAIQTISMAYQAGVDIVVGADAGNIGLLGGASMHREFALMADAGMAPGDILKAATFNGARALDLDHELGAVREGFLADILILSENPLESHENLAKIDYIMKDGHLLPHETLQRLGDATLPRSPRLDKGAALRHSHLSEQFEYKQFLRKGFCH